MEELCLSIDLGTGGPKIGLVSLDGDILDHELHPVVTHFTAGGGATQDPREWWTLICDASRRLLSRPDVTKEMVKAVAVTGQYASTVPVDANGEPTGPCLTWLDTRGGQYSRAALGGHVQGYSARTIKRFIQKTGGAPATSGADPVGQILYLMHAEPEISEATRWFMEPVDYLTMRFTGVASATHASRLAMWMTDNRDLSTFSYDHQLLAMVGIDGKRLPPLVPFGSIIGTVATDVASNLGLSPSTVVVTGLPDLHAATIGSGGTELYDTHLALSTTSWISCPVPKKKTDINNSIVSVPGLTNDSYLVINSQETGAKALEWLAGVLISSGQSPSYAEMNEHARQSPPGANGVIFTPWLAGERSPVNDKRVRAGFTNLSLTTNNADLIRAVLEGVATNSAWLFKYVEKFAGRTLTPVRLLGGGAQSALWCQIYADALDREVEQVPEPMVAQLRGASLLASVTLGCHELSDLSRLRSAGQTFTPNSEVAALYRRRRDQLPDRYRRDKVWSRRDNVANV
jgi:xylulokinase